LVLNDKEQFVARMRREGLTLKEIGNIMDITRERVRQIEERGIEKVRYAAEHGLDSIEEVERRMFGRKVA
jgi:DNA-directed RNA polymerase sigma subunit (sigma70/sigma32)